MTRCASGPKGKDHHVSQIDNRTRCSCRAKHPGAGADFGLGRLARRVPWRLPRGVFSQGLGIRTLGIRGRPRLVLLSSVSLWSVLNSQGDQPRRPIISSCEAGGSRPRASFYVGSGGMSPTRAPPGEYTGSTSLLCPPCNPMYSGHHGSFVVAAAQQYPRSCRPLMTMTGLFLALRVYA